MKTCPRCGYVRKESDTIIPDTECPKCGIIYSKWQQKPSNEEKQTRPSISKPVALEKDSKRKMRFERFVLLAVLAVLLITITVPQIIKYIRTEKVSSETALFQSERENQPQQQVTQKHQPVNNPSFAPIENGAPLKELSISDIIRDNRESIVVVKTQSSIGSGFFINRNGYIVTNKHVLPQGERAEIKTINGSVFRVNQIIHEDREADLVIVSTTASAQESKPVQLTSRLPDVGEKIIVIGNPMGLEQTVSDGIVSAVRRSQYNVEFIQVTAPVSPGNSGGPLFNMHGEVIGVATFQYRSGQNLNFCVAASRIAGMQQGTYSSGGNNSASDIKTPGRQDVYCYADSSGHVSFVDWKTGLQVSRPDGTLDRAKYEGWVMEQIGGHPDNINPDKEAREDLERNREKLFKSVFPHRSIDDTNLTNAEKEWLERRYQRHHVEVYNQAVLRRNEAIRKYRSMIYDFEKFAASRRQ